MGAAARMVTSVALDISVTAWRKAHPSDERHVGHADRAEAETERARMIRQLSDDAAEWEALGREEHAAKARAAADGSGTGGLASLRVRRHGVARAMPTRLRCFGLRAGRSAPMADEFIAWPDWAPAYLRHD